MYQTYREGNYVLVSEENSIFKIISINENVGQDYSQDFTLQKLDSKEKLPKVKKTKFEGIRLNENYVKDFGFEIIKEIERKVPQNEINEGLKKHIGKSFTLKFYKKKHIILLDKDLPGNLPRYFVCKKFTEELVNFTNIDKVFFYESEYYKINSVHSLQNYLADHQSQIGIDFDKIMIQRANK